jgi:hypothetical protein
MVDATVDGGADEEIPIVMIRDIEADGRRLRRQVSEFR